MKWSFQPAGPKTVSEKFSRIYRPLGSSRLDTRHLFKHSFVIVNLPARFDNEQEEANAEHPEQGEPYINCFHDLCSKGPVQEASVP
jgi:hypothetical protein